MAKKTSKPASGKARKPRAKKSAKASLRKTAAKLAQAADAAPGAAVLDRLYAVVLSRKGADPATSHSARLLSRGITKVAQKFGEEAVECLIEAVAGNHDALVNESADVLYHLLVVWVAAGVSPDNVWAELVRREGVSGIAEKAARARTLLLRQRITTRKIP